MNEPSILDRHSTPIRRMPAAVAALTMLLACSSPRPEGPDQDGERVGTYDPRAVAVAYANGPRFAKLLADLRQRHAAAVAEGREAEAGELEQQAIERQRRLHEQAFRGAGIDDILAMVADALPALCAASGVARLEPLGRVRPAGSATVDVTDRLIDLLEPSEQGRKWALEVRRRPLGS